MRDDFDSHRLNRPNGLVSEQDCARCGRRNLAFHSVTLPSGDIICAECDDPAKWAVNRHEWAAECGRVVLLHERRSPRVEQATAAPGELRRLS